MMKILMVHNYYQFGGGEDVSFNAEADLLEKMGNSVLRYTRNNKEIRDYGLLKKAQLFINTIWSFSTIRDLELILQKEKPDLVHFQNTFPLISPSAFYACKRQGTPVIVSVRNYRFMCVNGLFLRSDQICEECIHKKVAWPGIYHKCYRNSYLQSAVVAIMMALHRLRKTWVNDVHTYICLSEFSKSKLVQGVIPESKIVVKSNFVEDPGENREKRKYAIFIGRLSVEKGIRTILKSIQNNPDIPLVIIGSGPLEQEVKIVANKFDNVKYLGNLKHDQIMGLLRKAAFLIAPSIWYETFGRVVVEAYASGIPVISSKIGALQDLIIDGISGVFFEPKSAEDLSHKIRWLWDHPQESSQMGINARKEYLNKFTPEINYKLLKNIYLSVLEEKR